GINMRSLRESALWFQGPNLEFKNESVVPSPMVVSCGSCGLSEEKLKPLKEKLSKLPYQKFISFATLFLTKFNNRYKYVDRLNHGLASHQQLDVSQYANRYFWRFVQVEFMADVVESVNKDEQLPRRHPWREFKLFKDSHDLVRVDKRLANADLDYEMRYPLAVPRCQLVASYILFIHKLLHHPGANHTWSYIRQH